MATTTTYVAKASFKTAYLQREVVEDFEPAATFPKTVDSGYDGKAHVGDVFYLNSGEFTRRESSVNAATVKAAVQVGDYVLAQSDMTMGYGHVPVENRDYRYSDEVKMTDGVVKKFALYLITNLDDLILDTYSYQVTT